MKGVRVRLGEAEKVKKALIERNALDKRHKPARDKGHITFPVTKEVKGHPLVEADFPEIPPQQQYKQAAKAFLTPEERELFTRSFDVIGSIAILTIPPALEAKEKKLAELLLQNAKHVKTVLKKAGSHGGDFRTKPLTHLAGIETTETIYKENGIRLKLDVGKVYFSPRSSEERRHIASLIRKDEHVLVMFSGCAPFPLVIARQSQASEIVGIELNPLAHQYGLENLKLNKTKNIELIQGDVKDIIAGLEKRFDRVIMPLPKGAHAFLDTLLACTKKGAWVHYYAIRNQDEIRMEAERIKQFFRERKKKASIRSIRKAGTYAKDTYRFCIDFVFEN